MRIETKYCYDTVCKAQEGKQLQAHIVNSTGGLRMNKQAFRALEGFLRAFGYMRCELIVKALLFRFSFLFHFFFAHFW